MIPYIIINGKSSKDVNGLLIQSLPPISKPAIRTEVEEIDGRDGDIVTTLGYAAYDKTFTIGLRGDYNVDDVIAFFDSSGVIIFSNEIDKYYKFAAYEQIDFEKLIRFKTAEVTLHVQPFKYSAVDESYKLSNNNLLELSNYTITKNGITATVNNNIITVSGTPTATTELLLPIKDITLNAGNYELVATSNSDSDTKLKVVNNVASNSLADSATLINGTTTVSAQLTESKSFNYIWLSIAGSTAVNFTVSVQLVSSQTSGEITLVNRGNIYSRPIIKLVGSGNIDLYINGVQVLAIALGDNLLEITIDSVNMNAYNGNTYLNRLVTGDYDNVRLKVGTNTITWSGSVSDVTITDFSRWI